MSALIRGGRITPDDNPATVSLAEFLAAGREGAACVRLEADEEVEAIADCLGRISAIALHFPAFSDGRAYSSASILRRRYGFTGEIRAIGDVRIDQLEQMVRCGFDAFQLAAGQDAAAAMERLAGFSFSYQHTVDREPLFRTRS